MNKLEVTHEIKKLNDQIIVLKKERDILKLKKKPLMQAKSKIRAHLIKVKILKSKTC